MPNLGAKSCIKIDGSKPRCPASLSFTQTMDIYLFSMNSYFILTNFHTTNKCKIEMFIIIDINSQQIHSFIKHKINGTAHQKHITIILLSVVSSRVSTQKKTCVSIQA